MTSKKARLIEVIDLGQAELLRFAGQLSETERQTSGAPDHWAPRDVLAHLAEWKQRAAGRITAARRGETPAREGDYNAANAAIFEAYRARPWEDFQALLEGAHRDILAEAQALSEDDLSDPARFPWLQGRPLWWNIAGSCLVHPMSHLGQAYIERGDVAYANQMREREAQRVAGLGETPYWIGIAGYNLACHYALFGEKQKALEKLEQALSANPDLIDWSQQDSDLTSLHGEAAFRDLIERLGRSRRRPGLDRAQLTAALTMILDRYTQAGAPFEYRLVGTGAALLQGVTLPTGDIDLLVKERPAVEAFAVALGEFRCITPPTWLADARQYIAEFDVNGVEVGVSTVEWETDSDGIECLGRGPWEHYVWRACGSHQVPAVALELRLVSELARGRADRSEPLVQHLRAHGCDLALLQRGMQARQLPAAQQRRVLEQIGASDAAG